MTKTARLLIYPLLLIPFASVSLCLAADSPWNGTWKSNPAKSKYTGDTFTVTLKADGTYHYSNGSNVEYDFACDGKPHAAYFDRKVSCTGDAATGFNFTTTMANGNIVQKSRRTLSADGKTHTVDTTMMSPDGTTANRVVVYSRVGEGTGIVGQWKGVTEELSPFTCVIAISGGVWHEEHPAQQGKIDANLDGTDSPWLGPTYPEGLVASFKPEGPNKVRVLTKIRDKVVEEEILVLSRDGKTFTDEGWYPGKMAEKHMSVYEKQ